MAQLNSWQKGFVATAILRCGGCKVEMDSNTGASMPIGKSPRWAKGGKVHVCPPTMPRREKPWAWPGLPVNLACPSKRVQSDCNQWGHKPHLHTLVLFFFLRSPSRLEAHLSSQPVPLSLSPVSSHGQSCPLCHLVFSFLDRHHRWLDSPCLARCPLKDRPLGMIAARTPSESLSRQPPSVLVADLC